MIQYHDLIMDVLEFQRIIDAWFFRAGVQVRPPRFSDFKQNEKGGRK